jgi:hypothetical protein
MNQLWFPIGHDYEKVVVVAFGNDDAGVDSQRIDDLRQCVGVPHYQNVSGFVLNLCHERSQVAGRDDFRLNPSRMRKRRRGLLGALVFGGEDCRDPGILQLLTEMISPDFAFCRQPGIGGNPAAGGGPFRVSDQKDHAWLRYGTGCEQREAKKCQRKETGSAESKVRGLTNRFWRCLR